MTARAGSLAPAIVAGLGGLVLGLHVWRYPPADVSSMSLALFTWPRADKLASLAITLSWLAAINLAAWSCGALVERLQPLPRGLADLRGPYRIAIGSAVLALLVLLLAAAHLLVAAAFLALLALPPLLYVALQGASGLRTPAGVGWLHPQGRTLWVAAAGAALLAGAFLRALGPDPGWDALTYHLAFPERYLFENGVVMTPFSHLSGYIMIPQMLYLLALGVDGARLPVLIHFEFGVLVLVTLWRLGRRISAGAAVLAPLLLLADSLFQLEMGWAYSDLMLALYATLASIAFFDWMQHPRQTRSLVYAGILCGICCSTRYLGVVELLGLGVLVWLPPRHRELRANLGACLVLATCVGVLMLPWLVRNAVFTGNPIVPFLQSVFHAAGKEYIDPLVIQQSTVWVRSIGAGRDLASLLALPWNLSMATTPGVYSGGFGFQVGPLYAIGTLAALLIRDVREHPLVRPALVLILLQLVFWFYTVQEPRFLFPTFTLSAFVGGVAIDRLASRAAWGRALVALPVGAAVYCQLLSIASLPEAYAYSLGSLPRDYYERHEPIRRAAALLRDEMEDQDRLLLLFEMRGFLFRGLRYIPYHGRSGSPVLGLIHSQADPHGLHCLLQDMGVTHLLWNRNQQRTRPVFLPRYRYRDYVADQERLEAMLEAGGLRLFRKGGVEVYRLRRVACDGHAS